MRDKLEELDTQVTNMSAVSEGNEPYKQVKYLFPKFIAYELININILCYFWKFNK